MSLCQDNFIRSKKIFKAADLPCGEENGILSVKKRFQKTAVAPKRRERKQRWDIVISCFKKNWTGSIMTENGACPSIGTTVRCSSICRSKSFNAG